MDAAMDPWWEGELVGCAVADARLGQRLRKLITRMRGARGEPALSVPGLGQHQGGLSLLLQ